MARVTVTLDANLAIEVMLLTGSRNPQDAVELIVHDYLDRGRRTEERVESGEAGPGASLVRPPSPED